MNSINNKKPRPFNKIPSKILKNLSECSTDNLLLLVNKLLTSSRKFISNVKLADILPFCMKRDP